MAGKNIPLDKKVKENEPEIIPAIRNRWSPRAFSDKPVDKQDLLRLFEAARWAPSSFNEQPWRFIVGIRGDETYEKIRSTFVDWNLGWTDRVNVLVLIASKTYFELDGRENKHNMWDAGSAAGNIAIQATELGLYCHQMAGLDTGKADKIFEMPEGFKIRTAMAIGHLGDLEDLKEDYKEGETAERTRKPLEELVFTDGLQTAFDFS